MDFIETLKECNIKLHGLMTSDYRFVAWIIYSCKWDCFVAGVDGYSSNSKNDQIIGILKIPDTSAENAMKFLEKHITTWHDKREVPIGAEDGVKAPDPNI